MTDNRNDGWKPGRAALGVVLTVLSVALGALAIMALMAF